MNKFFALNWVKIFMALAGLVCGVENIRAQIPPDPPLRQLAEACGWHVGTAVAVDALRKEAAYREVLAREFNIVTPENAMKFTSVHPAPDRYTFADADDIVAFARANRMQVRGHTLVWHEQIPEWVKGAQRTPQEWELLLKDHIQTEVGHFRGKIAQWDVVNEAVAEDGSLRRTVWLDKLNPDYLDQAFRWAHEADPDTLLFYNDYNGEGAGKKADGIYTLLKGMHERGVPIDGVGLQMHISLDQHPDAAEITANLQRLAALRLKISITELDVSLKQPFTPELLAAQAEFYRKVFAACQTTPACRTFVLWGFTDAHSWIPKQKKGEGAALIYDENYAPKPAAHALAQALTAAAETR